MKTVMKKMFCLLMVAVLLVGVMPFQAFADGCTAAADCGASTHAAGCPKACTGGDDCTHVGVQHQPGCPKIPCSNSPTCGHTGDQHIAGCPMIPCSNSATCGHTGVQHVAGCPKIPCDGTTNCGHTGDQHLSSCPKTCDGTVNCPHTGVYHKADCKNIPCDKTANCPHKGVYHDSSCPKTCDGTVNCPHTGVYHAVTCASIPCDKTANCPHKSVYHDPNCPVVNPNAGNNGSGDNGSGNNGTGNNGTGNNGTGNNGTGNNGNGDNNTDNNVTGGNGDYSLKVYATMWTGDGREETVYLGTFNGLDTNTKIAQFMDQNSTTIHNWVAQACYGYQWSDGRIYEDKRSDDEIEWNDRMGYSDQEAYINVMRASKDVVIFVHTARTYVDHDWIKVEGKTTNDTLTLEEAIYYVRKYYNFGTLKMYSNDDWNAYVDGNNNIEPQKAVPIGSGNVTKIHVLITGASAKSHSSSSSSSSSAADSSNPKTGDAIYAPIMIMGLSASALAVMFYLNKKRAF